MATQWRTGFSGATGLDYNALPTVMRMCEVSRADQPDTFDCVRVMEGEVLDMWSKKQ